MQTFVTVAVLTLLSIIALVIGLRLRRNTRRRRLLSAPLPDEYREILENNVPLYRRLPEPLRERLHGLINVFLAEKQFEGCGGLELSDEIRVTIAAQACMLLLNRPTLYFSKLRTILVYPETYVAKAKMRDGFLEVDGHSIRQGESWQNGPVVLAWDSIKGGTRNIADAHNVVLHEFAHQLDQEDGTADGAPILADHSRYTAWARVLSEEYADLVERAQDGHRSVMDRYGATNPAEFFAVATETFFEKPRQLQKRHSELYEELKQYYKLDPVQWLEPEEDQYDTPPDGRINRHSRR